MSTNLHCVNWSTAVIYIIKFVDQFVIVNEMVVDEMVINECPLHPCFTQM